MTPSRALSSLRTATTPRWTPVTRSVLALVLCIAGCSETEVPSNDTSGITGSTDLTDTLSGSSSRFQTVDTEGGSPGDDVTASGASDAASGSEGDAVPPADEDIAAPEDAAPAPEDTLIVTPPGSPCEGTGSEPCYDGPIGTSEVGACSPGIRTCVDGAWSLCVGQVRQGGGQFSGIGAPKRRGPRDRRRGLHQRNR